MRKVKITLVVLILLVPFFNIINVSAITLGQYESKLAKYEQDARNNQAAINKTQAQINASNKEIANLKTETLNLSKEIVKLNEEVSNFNEEIKNKLLQSKQLLEYMQLSGGENAYLEYVFNADTISDMIYRAAIVQQVTDYNNRVIKDLKQMIKDNKSREKEIHKREAEIVKLEKRLENKVVDLGEEKSSLSEAGVTVSQQIKIYQELVSSYKKLGCKSNDVIGVDCAVSGEAGLFRRPTLTGYITQEAYYGSSYTHRGIDVGSSKRKSEKIYPVANGTIIAKYTDYYGALVIAIEHYSAVKKSWYTSLYAHLNSYAPNLYVGKNVTSDQYIGYMGETGKAYGVHLHLELIPCRLYNWSDANCSSWARYTNYAEQQLKKGYKGPRAMITFPSGTYNSWNSR